MKREVAWVAAAFAEWGETVEWFEENAPEVLNKFAKAVRRALRELSLGNHGLPVRGEPDVRRVRIAGFPIWLYFIEQSKRIVVIGFVHEKRGPFDWASRIART